MLIDEITRFGDMLFQDFRRVESERREFVQLALTALEGSDLIGQLTEENVSAEVARVQRLPRQRGGPSALGDPPITLYNAPDDSFYIEVLLHSTLSMAIHDHAFSGAFAVVSGKCAHQVFEFETEEDSDSLLIGELRTQHTESLEVGSARPIEGGMGFIHRNLHLDKPTVTVVIRTVWDGIHQHTYHYPGLALDGSMSSTESKQLRLLQGILACDKTRAVRYLSNLLAADITPGHAYRCLDFLLRQVDRGSYLEALLHAARPRLGHRTPAVESSLQSANPIEPELARLLSVSAAAGETRV